MIRELNDNEQELDKVMEIWKTSTVKAHPFIPELYWLESYKAVKEKYLPASVTYVYLNNNDIQGFISILEDQYIGALFVDKDSQGKGIGKSLMDYVKAKYDCLTLFVYKENEGAVNFYKKAGFILEYEQLNEQTGEPEYMMRFCK